jgi:hypothetical protein
LKANEFIDAVGVTKGKLSVAADDMTGYDQVIAGLTSNDLLSVEFFAKSSSGKIWQSLGTDSNAPYSVFINPKDYLGQNVELKAVATNSKGAIFELPSAQFNLPTS